MSPEKKIIGQGNITIDQLKKLCEREKIEVKIAEKNGMDMYVMIGVESDKQE